ncbi:hypothetical protein EZS27_033949 [termite gut metagenome]|uniref:Uncharacterized protein n=1 Tax=termite gut metagenome TaxID=433724 RepID=A0A5J4Q1K3_9ZZZZ
MQIVTIIIYKLNIMAMNELLKTKLFNLLIEPSQEVTNEEMQNTYGHFVKHVEAVSFGNDYTIIYRNLNIRFIPSKICIIFFNLYLCLQFINTSTNLQNQ